LDPRFGLSANAIVHDAKSFEEANRLKGIGFHKILEVILHPLNNPNPIKKKKISGSHKNKGGFCRSHLAGANICCK